MLITAKVLKVIGYLYNYFRHLFKTRILAPSIFNLVCLLYTLWHLWILRSSFPPIEPSCLTIPGPSSFATSATKAEYSPASRNSKNSAKMDLFLPSFILRLASCTKTAGTSKGRLLFKMLVSRL